ncbi:MAG: gamma-glutamyl-gamma-aminobutyrate hydrolase family protein [Actinomycetota bacterium]
MAPVIGISAYREQARWGVWDTGAVLLPQHYSRQVAAAGGVPVLLPPLPGIEQAVARLDGLILSGGSDVGPDRYGAEPDPHTRGVRPDRDLAEAALLAAALNLGVPVLGICRGLQVINVARGGTLHQHLPDVVGHAEHGPVPGSYGSHPVHVAAGSKLAAVLGRTELDGVPTHHHQAIDRLGDGLTAVAWTSDQMIEAVEVDAPGCPFALAVQWHPEAGSDPSLFQALVAAASGATHPRHQPRPSIGLVEAAG